MAEPEFRYFAAVPEKGLATRYGTGTYFGAHRDPSDPRKVVFVEGEVVRVPLDEYFRFRREYDKTVRSGALAVRSEADFDDWEKLQAKRSEADTAQAREALEKANAEALEAERAALSMEPPAPETPKKKGNKK